MARAISDVNTFKLNDKFLGASSNIDGLLSRDAKRNRIICLDFLGPLKMSKVLYTSDELVQMQKHKSTVEENEKKLKQNPQAKLKKVKPLQVPQLPDRYNTIKFWLAVKIDILTNIVHVSIVPELSTASVILDLKIYMCKHGPIQFIFTDAGSNFLPMANQMTGNAEIKDLNNPQFKGHHLRELLDPKYQKQLNVLGGSLILMAKGRHQSLSSAENLVKILKYSLKSTGAWNSLYSGKLTVFQADYIIQSLVRSLNTRPLFIINKKIISPEYIQNIIFERAYDSNVLDQLAYMSETQRAEKFKHVLDSVHDTVREIHKQFAMKVIPRLLECKNVEAFKHRRGGSVKSLKLGSLVFCPVSYYQTYNIRYSIFKVIWVSDSRTWCIVSRPSYNVRKYDPRIDLDNYRKAVQNNILKTRSSEQLYLLNPDINIEEDNFVPLDKIFRPFDLASLLNETELGSYSDSFLQLTDPALDQLILKHKTETQFSEDGTTIITVPGKTELDDQMHDYTNEDDPLNL